jgi:predicted membrane protein
MSMKNFDLRRIIIYPFSTIARRIIKFMRTRRDIILILLGLLLTALITYFPDILRANWDLPKWEVIFLIIADLLGLTTLVFFIRRILKELKEIDEKERIEQQKKETRQNAAMRRNAAGIRRLMRRIK